jgi:hypothetical protein
VAETKLCDDTLTEILSERGFSDQFDDQSEDCEVYIGVWIGSKYGHIEHTICFVLLICLFWISIASDTHLHTVHIQSLVCSPYLIRMRVFFACPLQSI